MSDTKIRYHLLDEIRGFMVLCMVFYHGFFLGDATFGIEFLGDLLYFFMPIEPLFAAGFVFICGFCTVYSRSNYIHGAKIIFAALAVSAVTFGMTKLGLAQQNDFIMFGILHLLGVSVLLSEVMSKLIIKLPLKLFSLISAFLFVLTYSVQYGYIGIGKLTVTIPEALTSGNYLFFLGFVNEEFAAGDYFPIIPWFFIFLSGWFLGRFTKGKLPEFFIKSRIKPFSFLGRHALICYLIHQPVWFGIFYLIKGI